METFTMTRKELPRPGLVRAALAGQISNRQGAQALRMTIRQFQRLKARYREAGALGLRHRGRGQPSPRRVAPEVRARVVALMTECTQGSMTPISPRNSARCTSC